MSEKKLKAALETAVPGLAVYDVDDPLNIGGTVDAKRFAFVTEGRSWAFSVVCRGDADPSLAIVGGVPVWRFYGEHAGAALAALMSDADVIACISKAVELWRARDKAPTNPYDKPEWCGDGGCVVWPASGMHTNGGCKCSLDRWKMAKALAWYRWEYEHRRTA